ncbi:hypothetical protein [Sphingobacterium detergens]|uniref:Uncharacterized protein n=1 Tax=Sphingobacterium detergens TaxID=1145106 RepID=A0A420B6X2_SPHD1|nr:hypothetical protein [Sphingobacterium detergens]RKE52398.1 hypothetical protein DFQ12_2634 [Sphingobacterium detergens]
MKKVIFGLSLLALTSAAFAGNRNDSKTDVPSENKAATTTYYAIKNPPGSAQPFHWTSNFNEVLEAELSCDPLPGASCEVEAASQPIDGQMPSGQSPSNEAYQ